MQLAEPTIPGLTPPNPEVVARLLLTLLFLPVAGLARTWDLRSYTGTMLAVLTGRERAYSQRYTERFLGGKILGCRELVVLHDADGHPLLATTHRGDHHLTIGLPQMLHCVSRRRQARR